MQANSTIFYPHYCYDCQMQYFGIEQSKVKSCPRCGSGNTINGPLTHGFGADGNSKKEKGVRT